MKQITKYIPSICGFNVILFKGITESNTTEEEINRCLEDPNLHSDEEFFGSYSQAQEHLFNNLKEDNDYYFGMIISVWYEYKQDEDGNPSLGECKEHICVAEAWAEDIGD